MGQAALGTVSLIASYWSGPREGRGWSHTEMLLARYFLSVGGILLALLFVADAIAPKVPAAATDSNDTAVDKSVIRIHSDRKWPEPVVFDTNVPTIAPAQTVKAGAAAAPPPP